jgi:hypothetical protein
LSLSAFAPAPPLIPSTPTPLPVAASTLAIDAYNRALIEARAFRRRLY